MTTNDVFQRAVTAMASFVTVPLAGKVDRLGVTTYDVTITLDDEAQPAQALLAWLGSLAGAGRTDRRLSHHHANGKTFVAVEGERDGLTWDVYTTFTGEDAAVLCDGNHDDNHARLPVHRLRLVQMRQLARAVAA